MHVENDVMTEGQRNARGAVFAGHGSACFAAPLGNHGDAMKFMRLAQTSGGGNPYVLYDVVVVWLLLDSLPDALDSYKALEDTGFPKSILDAEPMFDALRSSGDKNHLDNE